MEKKKLKKKQFVQEILEKKDISGVLGKMETKLINHGKK